ncbi:crAss001_48 related protein [Ligilactobacillus ruminis]|uniref:crAss001_48 related protein n=1 Tax=Ligilactobacillus ruminis TaxID=1623 RepID=UPI00384EBDE0
MKNETRIFRISRLRRMIVLAKADKLEFKLSCKDELLEEQLEAMEKYALVLETRAII